jgi:hypothetical protein
LSQAQHVLQLLHQRQQQSQPQLHLQPQQQPQHQSQQQSQQLPSSKSVIRIKLRGILYDGNLYQKSTGKRGASPENFPLSGRTIYPSSSNDIYREEVVKTAVSSKGPADKSYSQEEKKMKRHRLNEQCSAVSSGASIFAPSNTAAALISSAVATTYDGMINVKAGGNNSDIVPAASTLNTATAAAAAPPDSRRPSTATSYKVNTDSIRPSRSNAEENECKEEDEEDEKAILVAERAYGDIKAYSSSPGSPLPRTPLSTPTLGFPYNTSSINTPTTHRPFSKKSPGKAIIAPTNSSRGLQAPAPSQAQSPLLMNRNANSNKNDFRRHSPSSHSTLVTNRRASNADRLMYGGNDGEENGRIYGPHDCDENDGDDDNVAATAGSGGSGGSQYGAGMSIFESIVVSLLLFYPTVAILVVYVLFLYVDHRRTAQAATRSSGSSTSIHNHDSSSNDVVQLSTSARPSITDFRQRRRPSPRHMNDTSVAIGGTKALRGITKVSRRGGIRRKACNSVRQPHHHGIELAKRKTLLSSSFTSYREMLVSADVQDFVSDIFTALGMPLSRDASELQRL